MHGGLRWRNRWSSGGHRWSSVVISGHLVVIGGHPVVIGGHQGSSVVIGRSSGGHRWSSVVIGGHTHPVGPRVQYIRFQYHAIYLSHLIYRPLMGVLARSSISRQTLGSLHTSAHRAAHNSSRITEGALRARAACALPFRYPA